MFKGSPHERRRQFALTFGGKYCIRNLAGVFGNGLELLDGSSIVWRQRRVQIGFLFFSHQNAEKPDRHFYGTGSQEYGFGWDQNYIKVKFNKFNHDSEIEANWIEFYKTWQLRQSWIANLIIEWSKTLWFDTEVALTTYRRSWTCTGNQFVYVVRWREIVEKGHISRRRDRSKAHRRHSFL